MIEFYDNKGRLIGKLGQFEKSPAGSTSSFNIESDELFAGFEGFVDAHEGLVTSLRPVILRPQPDFIDEDASSSLLNKLAVVAKEPIDPCSFNSIYADLF